MHEDSKFVRTVFGQIKIYSGLLAAFAQPIPVFPIS